MPGISEYEKLCRRRTTYKNSLSTLITKAADPDNTVQKLKLLLTKTNELFREATKVHTEMNQCAREDELDIIQAEYEEVEKKFEDLQEKLTIKLDTACASSPVQEVKLPKLSLPDFTGKPEEWLAFHDLYTVSVHNNGSLAGSQKLQYLKAALKGDASRIIQASIITDTNYDSAWERVKTRYHNIREIVHSVIKKLISQPNLLVESPFALRNFVDVTNEFVSSLKVLNHPVNDDKVLVVVLLHKLDEETRKQWELSLSSTEPPTLKELMDFLEQRARAITTIEDCKDKSIVKSSKRPTTSTHVSQSSNSCILCGEDHYIARCNKCSTQSVESRLKLIKSNNLCYNCLKKGHSASSCSSSGRCQRCQKRHHTTVHADIRKDEKPATPTTVTVPSLTCSDNNNDNILLATALVKILNAHGGQQPCRALLDTASQRSFITEACVQSLGLPRVRARVDVAGVGGSVNTTCRGKVVLRVSSFTMLRFETSVEVLIISKITGDTPSFPLPRTTWPHISNLKLADPEFGIPAPIHILFGANVLNEFNLEGIHKGPAGTPAAYNTVFGWTLLGSTTTASPLTTVSSLVIQDSLDAKLERFWKLEDVPSKLHLTEEERLCEDHFIRTYKRDSTGKYIVELPFKEDHQRLGASRGRALARFLQQEDGLQRKPLHKQLYVQFMREYEALGHMVLIPEEDIPCQQGECFYLPHHAVFKWTSTTTKCRVVFDASCKSTTGQSLNDVLMNGPTIQDPLFSHLLRFRSHIVPFIADIEKMYRMIGISRVHWNYQRIFWREEPSHPLKEFWLTVVTFGMKPAPFLAVRCLRQCAEDEGVRYPNAYKIVMADFYVDNLMSGSQDLQTATKAVEELPAMLSRGNLNLREWFSSSGELLTAIPQHLRGNQDLINLDKEETVGTLGLKWHLGLDCFKYVVQLPKAHRILTKRSLASDVASLYDPLGWLSPIMVLPKDLIRRCWQGKVDWDSELPTPIKDEWTAFRKSLPNVQNVYIPRCLSHPTAVSHQLIGFCDASEKAYAACIYVRVVNRDGGTRVDLATSKMKIAPVSHKSIPRLELCAAVLLSNLMTTVDATIGLSFTSYHAWSDSRIVLAWLASHPRRWSTFVGNRVAAIQEADVSMQWHHVPSELNPADCASRGISPEELGAHNLWWHGPPFLQRDLPLTDETITVIPDRALEEERVSAKVIHIKTECSLISRFSSLQTLTRVIAYLIRFKNNSQTRTRIKKGLEPQQEIQVGFIKIEEQQRARRRCITLVQEHSWPEDIRSIIKGRPLSHSSKLLSLNPFLDNEGVLRVGGRIQRANVAGDQKHPVLLPRCHHLTTLVIREEHHRLLHAGPQAVLAALHRRFWIINGRDAVRHVIGRCITCVRLRATVGKQMMGNLPTTRVNPARPFLNCGVDYAGPFQLRVLKVRGQKHFKAYLALFVCFSTRALHLELVSELTSTAFIACLKRFVSRRGKPQSISSDNGTNFVGANRELREFEKLVLSLASEAAVQKHLVQEACSPLWWLMGGRSPIS